MSVRNALGKHPLWDNHTVTKTVAVQLLSEALTQTVRPLPESLSCKERDLWTPPSLVGKGVGGLGSEKEVCLPWARAQIDVVSSNWFPSSPEWVRLLFMGTTRRRRNFTITRKLSESISNASFQRKTAGILFARTTPAVLRLGSGSGGKHALENDKDVAGLIAPRSLLTVCGKEDPLHSVTAISYAVERLKRIYEASEQADRYEHRWGEGGHRFYKKLMWPFVLEAMAAGKG